MKTRPSAQCGSALLPTLMAVILLVAFSGVVFRITMSHSSESARAGRELRAFYVAETGVSETILAVVEARRDKLAVPTEYGTADAPVKTRSGSFHATIADNGDESYTIVSTATVGGARRSIETVLRPADGGVFDHAVFAGNASGDPNYVLKFGGTGSQGDNVVGGVYSAGDVEVSGDATISGEVLASGVITGVVGTENVARPLPDIAGMDYANNHDVDVAAAFASGGTLASNALGGKAYQLPEANPAHIFRKNPDDRLAEVNGTTKDDFFLEDPYMPVTDFTAAFNGSQGHTITLSGAPSKPGSDGNNLLYYIDGNLWVHNSPFGRLRFMTQGDGMHVTFVVKGNVYFSDDVLLMDENRDAVAFIAVKDESVADSGNIYLGDPRYGTLDRMYAYMYAENDFIDNNLAADGSKVVEVRGNMTAGNQVAIERDFVKADGSVAHSRLGVQFDGRLSRGEVTLPGIPRSEAGIGGFEIVFWREVGDQ